MSDAHKPKPLFKRVVVKLSGEALMGEDAVRPQRADSCAHLRGS